MKNFIIFSVSLLFLFSCANDSSKYNSAETAQMHTECATKISLDFAQKFYIEETKYGYRLSIFANNLGQKDTLCFHLDRTGKYSSDKEPVIPIPVTRIMTLSSTHLEFIQLLDELPSVCATCQKEFIYSDNVRQLIDEGKIIAVSNTQQIDKERMVLAQPELVMVSDLRDCPNLNDQPLITCLEWKEKSALARAEWIKFFGLFFDKLSMADSIFQETKKNYLELKALAQQDTIRPTLFAAGSYGDTWYLTGGDGYMAALYQDANAQFCLADTLVGTVVCGLEWLITHFQETDVWMNCQALEMSELDERLSILKSYQEGRIYHFNQRATRSNGSTISDFYESAVAHPDRVLKDVVAILHPQLVPNYTPYYVGQVKSKEKKQ